MKKRILSRSTIWTIALLSIKVINSDELCAQEFNLLPDAWIVSYSGEMITHPGLEVLASYKLWEGNSKEKTMLAPNLEFQTGISTFYHKNYQLALILIPSLSYSLKSRSRTSFGMFTGAGYMKTFLPKVYLEGDATEFVRVRPSNNYMAAQFGINIRKRLNQGAFLDIEECSISPVLMVALPNYPKTSVYFLLNAGIRLSCSAKK